MRALLAILLLLAGAVQAQVPTRAWQYQGEMTRSAYRVFGPGAPVATLAGQIHQESGWDADARSWVGAQGLAQFMPATAADMARLHPAECAPANPFSARWAFACRDRYLASLNRASERAFPGEPSPCSVWAFGLRAYNGGLGWLNRDRRKAAAAGADPSDWLAVQPFNAGRSAAAFRENTEYPVRIFRAEARYLSWGAGMRCKES